MADCFHTTYARGGSVLWLSCRLDSASQRQRSIERVVKIVTVTRNCIFNTDSIQLKVGDIITEINDKEITSIDVFRRKRKTRTTFRKLLQDEEEEEPDPQPQHLMEHERGNVALKNHKHANIEFRSPTLWMPLLKDKNRVIKVLKRKCARHKEWKRLKEDGVFVSNVNAEVLFAEEELQKCYDELLERNCSASFMSLYRSRKSNGEGRKVFSVNEVQSFKVRRPKIEHTARKPAAAVVVNRVVPQPQPQPPRQLPQEVQELVDKVASSYYHGQQIANVLFQAFDPVRVRMAEPEEARNFEEVAYQSYTEFFQDDSWFRNPNYSLDYRQQCLWELPQLTRYIMDD